MSDDATVILDNYRDKRIVAPLPTRQRAWERAIAPPIGADELRDAYRTLKEAHRRQDPDLEEWRGAFHRKLERFLNQ